MTGTVAIAFARRQETQQMPAGNNWELAVRAVSMPRREPAQTEPAWSGPGGCIASAAPGQQEPARSTFVELTPPDEGIHGARNVACPSPCDCWKTPAELRDLDAKALALGAQGRVLA